jgi:NhaP-type Na+/H+ or K+/H+ antiporter
MTRRLAVSIALVVFALCLALGVAAENSFVETVSRALKAMFATLLVGLLVGAMAQKMLEENIRQLAKKSQIQEAKPQPKDR